jgi:hypothetical protein
MQRVLGRLAAQFLGGVGSAGSTTAPVPAAAPIAPRAAPASRAATDSTASLPSPQRLAGPSHALLGEQHVQDVLVITFCAAISLIGWLMVLQGAEQIRAARAVAHWPTAQGIIESVDVYPMERAPGPRWRPHVTYSYAVGARIVTASRLCLGRAPAETTSAAAEAYLGRYPPGSAVTVYFNPHELTESVLDVATPATAYLNLGFGVLLALFGPLLLVLFGFWPQGRVGK